MNTEDVTDEEHIAFLTYWLTFFVFCSSSLQVAVKYVTLAIKLPKKEDICLNKLILASLYEALNIASFDIKLKKNGCDSLLIAGPMWLLQFWLSAKFEPKIPQGIPIDMPRYVEGTRLNLLTPEDRDFSNAEAFDVYFRIFSQQKHFVSAMAPFSSRNYGTEWFQRKFP